jgi:hypothetical protein
MSVLDLCTLLISRKAYQCNIPKVWVVHSKEAMEHKRRFIFSYRNGSLAYTWILENRQLYFPDKTFGEMSTDKIPKGTDKTLSLYTDGFKFHFNGSQDIKLLQFDMSSPLVTGGLQI